MRRPDAMRKAVARMERRAGEYRKRGPSPEWASLPWQRDPSEVAR